MSRYTIGDNFYPKHNIIKSMVGPFPLAPHHDHLQYMYHVYLMQTGSKPGCYTPFEDSKDSEDWKVMEFEKFWSDVLCIWCN